MLAKQWDLSESLAKEFYEYRDSHYFICKKSWTLSIPIGEIEFEAQWKNIISNCKTGS
jgi:hypothetical protein